MLDGLHEDLNTAARSQQSQQDASPRPGVEAGEPAEEMTGQPPPDPGDPRSAEKMWRAHRDKNSSVISDLFHGLLRSGVGCLECGFESVTYEPFVQLSLPLVTNAHRTVMVVVVWADAHKTPTRYALRVPVVTGTVNDLLIEAAALTGIREDRFRIREVIDNMFVREISPTDRLSSLRPNDLLYLYDMAPSAQTTTVLIRVQSAAVRKSRAAGAQATGDQPNLGPEVEPSSNANANSAGLSAFTQSVLAPICPPIIVEVTRDMDYYSFTGSFENRLLRAASFVTGNEDSPRTNPWIPEVPPLNAADRISLICITTDIVLAYILSRRRLCGSLI